MEASEQINFSILDSSDYSSLLNLITDMYPHLGWSETYLNWQYLENPAGKAVNWIASKGAKALGNYTALPFQVQVRGKVNLGWRPQDVLTRPAYSGFGIYFRLSVLANEFLKSSKYPLNFSFPNEKSHNGFIKNDWVPAFRIPLRVLTNVADSKSQPSRNKFEKITKFDATTESIWKSHAARYDFSLHRTAAYLNWRYFRNPKAQYSAFLASEAGNDLVIILKYHDRENGERWAHICDLFLAKNSLSMYEEALKYAITFAKENKCQGLSCWWPQGNLDSLFEKYSFVLQKDLTRWLLVNCNLPEISRTELCDEKRWHLVMGDSDVY